MKILVLLVALISTSVSFAQPPPPPASGGAKSSIKEFRGWPSINTLPAQPGFVSLEGRFRIGFPKDIQGFGALSPKETGTNASGQQLRWKFAEAEVVGFVLDFPDSTLTGTAEEVSQIAANSKKLLTDRMPTARLVSESSSTISGVPSTYFIYDVGAEGFISVNLFLDQKRLYRFNSVFKERATEETLTKVFKTFSLITQAEVDSELRKKYEEMKPAPLPQTPVVAKVKSDASDAGLKGKIKKVVTESEDRSGTWSVQGRKLSSAVYYDQNGALTQRDAYDSQGNPFQVTVYGYIDGKRVSNSKMTRYEYDPPPAAAPPGMGTAETPRKRDSRYDYSFEYRYENGRLVEKLMVYNDGRKGMKYVYNHSPNQVEELVYTEEGKLNQRYLSILDANGNVIERTDFGVVNFHIYGDRKYRSSYELDANGNWIKETTTKAETVDGTTVWRPYAIYYRTITYH